MDTTLMAAGTVAAGVAGDYLVGKGIDLLCSMFKSSVIDRWSRRRAEEFIRTFCEQVAAGDDAGLEAKLNQVVEDDVKSEVLFDAYRRVALSASPKLGPRIIALIMAKVIGENRRPTQDEEQLLSVAERLSDDELRCARDHFNECVVKLKLERGSYHDRGERGESAGVDFWADWGSWAAKLADAGLIIYYIGVAKQIGEPDYDEGAVVFHGHELTDVHLTTDLYYPSSFKDLAELVSQAETLSGESAKR